MSRSPVRIRSVAPTWKTRKSGLWPSFSGSFYVVFARHFRAEKCLILRHFPLKNLTMQVKCKWEKHKKISRWTADEKFSRCCCPDKNQDYWFFEARQTERAPHDTYLRPEGNRGSLWESSKLYYNTEQESRQTRHSGKCAKKILPHKLPKIVRYSYTVAQGVSSV